MHAGRRLKLNGRSFKLRGYLASTLDLALDHEPAVFHAMRRVLKERPGAFVDVGMNNGQSLLKLLRIDPDRTYVGFEPQLLCAASIHSFVSENRLLNKHVLPIALGDRAEIRRIHYRRLTDESAALDRSFVADAPYSSFVQVARGDDVLDQLGLGEVALLKVDVEGHENAVLTGLQRMLGRTSCPIIFEVVPMFKWPVVQMAPDDRRRFRERAEALWNLLERLGYAVFGLNDLGEERPVRGFVLDDPQEFTGQNYIARRLRAD